MPDMRARKFARINERLASTSKYDQTTNALNNGNGSQYRFNGPMDINNQGLGNIL